MSTDNLSRLEIDLSAKRSKSLTLLKRVNEAVFEIVHDATQAAVYNFNLKTNGWEKAGIEGALFLTRNSVAPLYSVFVLNKLAPDNFELHLDNVISVSCQSPFIMLRYATDGAPAIAGLWLLDDTSRNEMMAAITTARERMNGVAPSALSTTSSPSKTNKLKGFLGKQTPVKTSAAEEGSSASKTNMLKGLLGKVGDEAPVAAPTETVFSASASQKLLGALKGGPAKEKGESVTPEAGANKNDASKKLLGMLKAKAAAPPAEAPVPAPAPAPVKSSGELSREEKQREVVMKMMLGQQPKAEEKKEPEREPVPVQEPPKKIQTLISPSDLFSM